MLPRFLSLNFSNSEKVLLLGLSIFLKVKMQYNPSEIDKRLKNYKNFG